MFQRCLICTDFSDGLYRLVDFIPSLAASGIKKIVFLHSVPFREEGGIPRVDEEKVKQARDRLSQALQSVPDGVEVHIEVPSGRPTDAIAKAAAAYQVDVIFSGMSIRNLLQEKLFGSTTLGVAKSKSIPFLILRPQLVSTYTCEELNLRCQHLWRYFLIPYDDSHAANYVIEKLKQYAKNRPSGSSEQCMLCWVVDDSRHRGMGKEEELKQAKTKLQAVKADLEALGLQVNTQVLVGNPLTKILELAVDLDISAIALSSDSLGSLMEWSVPSFAGELLRSSWHPIVFFPSQR